LICSIHLKQFSIHLKQNTKKVGLVEYSLKKGIIREYHSFIKPNEIPLGYRSKCMEFVNKNKTPLHSSTLFTRTYSQIYSSIYNFINWSDTEDGNINKNKNIKIFTPLQQMERTKFGLDFLYNSAITDGLKDIDPLENIIEVDELFISLNRFANRQISKYSVAEQLNRYNFDYSSNTRCDFHEENEVIECALGSVKRCCYTISDYVCQHYGIELTNNHVPEEKNEGQIMHNYNARHKSEYADTESDEEEVQFIIIHITQSKLDLNFIILLVLFR
jgi:protein maelstrom